MDYHEEITNAVVIFLQGQTRYTNQRYRSNAEAEGICRLIYNSTRSVVERVFGLTGKARGTKSVSNKATHVVEYFSYLPVIAAAHALADIASESPFWWFANQIATLVLTTDAITEYNGQVGSTSYGVIAQALLADALNRLKGQNDVFKTVTSFSLTELQGLPSVVKPGFWNHDSDLEHRSDYIAGTEQNASMGLFRKLLLDCDEPCTITLLNSALTIESSRRLARFVRESAASISQVNGGTVVCSCETVICYPPETDPATRLTCLSVTSAGLLYPRCSESIAEFKISLACVLLIFYVLSKEYHTVNQHCVHGMSPAGILLMVVFVFAYKMLRKEPWTWVDIIRGSHYVKTIKNYPFPLDPATVIRVLNDYRTHFKFLALRTSNNVLLGGSFGDFDFDVGFSLKDLRAAGMIIYSDNCNNYVLDPHGMSENDLKVHRLHKITQDKFIIDDEPVQHMRPALVEVAAG
ncbi:hypothetical protein BGZ75_004940 [Mortierella antarctica]|nr:hypothetical protein BGZ75_004940 [Mortierella antarctica]